MTKPGPSRNISVIGLGKVGAPIAATFASKGHRVIGVDENPHAVSLVNEGRAPVFEPGLEALMLAARQHLVATEDYEAAIGGSDITFIVMPTPSDESGGLSLRAVLRACERIGDALHKKAAYHLTVLTSTVLPGSTDNIVRPLLEARSGKRCALDFGLCYSPEFIALGRAIHDLLNPDYVLIGESDPRVGELLASFYRAVCDNDPPIARMSTVNAELTKLAVNSFITTKITFANMLARICERLPGANVDVVTATLGLDTRIGPKYLKGAIGYGGPCFPRDNMAFSYFARCLGLPAELAEATDAANRQQVPLLMELIRSRLPNGGHVGILGLAYKPNTDVIEGSQGLALAQSLLAENIAVVVYDPVSMENAKKVLNDGVKFASSVAECAREADFLVVATPWDEFKHIQPAHLTRENSRPVLLDCWRILDGRQFEGVAEYLPTGVGP